MQTIKEIYIEPKRDGYYLYQINGSKEKHTKKYEDTLTMLINLSDYKNSHIFKDLLLTYQKFSFDVEKQALTLFYPDLDKSRESYKKEQKDLEYIEALNTVLSNKKGNKLKDLHKKPVDNFHKMM